MNRLRIVLLAHSCNPEWPSESYVGYQWFSRLQERYDIMLITRSVNRPFLQKTAPKNTYYINTPEFLTRQRLHNYGAPDYFYHNVKTWFSLRTTVLGFKPDLIHLLTPIAPRYSTYLSYLKVPLVIGPLAGALKVHSSFMSLERISSFRNLYHRLSAMRMYVDPFLVHTYSKAARILVACDYLTGYLRPSWRAKTVQILETGIDEGDFRVKARSEGQQPRVLFVGRLVPLKGVQLLLRAFAPANAEEKKMRLDIVGSGPQEVYLKDLARNLGIGESVQFHGWLSAADVRDMYQRADIFCLPTINDSTGNVLLEAMAAGLPIVTTNYGGPAQIVTRECGILIDLTTRQAYVDQLSEALRTLVKSKDLRDRMGRAGQDRCRQQFTWNKKMARVAEIYREIVTGTDGQ